MRRVFKFCGNFSEILEKCLQAKDFEECGCSIVFLGFVKGISGGKRVAKYSVREEEGIKEKLERICMEAEQKFSLIRTYIFKNFGELAPGDLITAVVVLARGRREGFNAASWIVDKIKEAEKGIVEETFVSGATGGI